MASWHYETQHIWSYLHPQRVGTGLRHTMTYLTYPWDLLYHRLQDASGILEVLGPQHLRSIMIYRLFEWILTIGCFLGAQGLGCSSWKRHPWKPNSFDSEPVLTRNGEHRCCQLPWLIRTRPLSWRPFCKHIAFDDDQSRQGRGRASTRQHIWERNGVLSIFGDHKSLQKKTQKISKNYVGNKPLPASNMKFRYLMLRSVPTQLAELWVDTVDTIPVNSEALLKSSFWGRSTHHVWPKKVSIKWFDLKRQSESSLSNSTSPNVNHIDQNPLKSFRPHPKFKNSWHFHSINYVFPIISPVKFHGLLQLPFHQRSPPRLDRPTLGRALGAGGGVRWPTHRGGTRAGGTDAGASWAPRTTQTCSTHQPYVNGLMSCDFFYVCWLPTIYIHLW